MTRITPQVVRERLDDNRMDKALGVPKRYNLDASHVVDAYLHGTITWTELRDLAKTSRPKRARIADALATRGRLAEAKGLVIEHPSSAEKVRSEPMLAWVTGDGWKQLERRSHDRFRAGFFLDGIRHRRDLLQRLTANPDPSARRHVSNMAPLDLLEALHADSDESVRHSAAYSLATQDPAEFLRRSNAGAFRNIPYPYMVVRTAWMHLNNHLRRDEKKHYHENRDLYHGGAQVLLEDWLRCEEKGWTFPFEDMWCLTPVLDHAEGIESWPIWAQLKPHRKKFHVNHSRFEALLR